MVASGSVARRLIARLLASDTDLRALSGVATSEDVVVLGPPEALPWCDGVRYLGTVLEAPDLLLPTTLAPTAPADLVQRVVWRAHPDLVAPVALWPLEGPPERAASPRLVAVSLAHARPLGRTELRAWLDATR